MKDKPESEPMMLFDETLVSLVEAAKLLPAPNGKHPHASTLWRWSTKGIGGIHLETRRVGARLFTSREALERFTKALAEAGPVQDERHAPRPRSAARRAREIAAADEELRKAGL